MAPTVSAPTAPAGRVLLSPPRAGTTWASILQVSALRTAAASTTGSPSVVCSSSSGVPGGPVSRPPVFPLESSVNGSEGELEPKNNNVD